MKTHKTKNDLPSNAKSTVMGILNESLASVIDLALVTKQAHWNLKGPQFIAVHELLDTFRAQLDNHGDTIAERVVQLGGTALGSLQSVSSTTKLKAYPTDIYKIHDH
jgi:starvation-inducible DNA-binding protein